MENDGWPTHWPEYPWWTERAYQVDMWANLDFSILALLRAALGR